MEQFFVFNLLLIDLLVNKMYYFVVVFFVGDKIGYLNIKLYIRSLVYDI